MTTFAAITAASVDDIVKRAILADMQPPTATTTEAPTAPEAATAYVTVISKTLNPGQMWASKLLGIRKFKDDFPVTLAIRSEIPGELQAHIPEVDDNYVIQQDAALAILRAWELGDKALITGPRGAGKSSLVKQLCALTGRPFIRVNMTEDAESSDMIGKMAVEGGATVWRDGAITEAVRHGAVCLVDEWDVTPPGIMFALQNLLEDGGYLFLKEMAAASTEERTVRPADGFRLVMAGNTLGQGDESGEYAGTTVQNSATLDRFGTTVHLGYLSAAHEVAIVTGKCPGLSKEAAEKMVKVAELIRNAHGNGDISLTMSPRGLLSWGKKAEFMGKLSDALEVAFTNKLRQQDRRLVTEFFIKVFAKSDI